MAEEKTAELDTLAFDIFAKRMASHQVKRGVEQEAIDAYRKAEAFLAVKARVKGGGVKAEKPDGPQLCDCCAPNLKRNHPHNLVSQRFGDLNKVNRIKKWLDANPTPESDPEELAEKMGREFPDLAWDMPTINTARAIFPAYVKN